jgi:aminoglycoside phosphotransferase (APT) family kinase protein
LTIPLDIENPTEALAYLRAAGLIATDESPRIEVLKGGVSSRTVWVDRNQAEPLVLKQSLAKLRVAVDWFSDPERIFREALAMRYLGELAPQGSITHLIREDRECGLIAMEAVPRPHSNWKSMLLAGDLREAHVRRFAGILAAVHQNSAERSAELEPLFGDRRFFETLRIEPYYRYPAAQFTGTRAATFLCELIEDTLSTGVAMVHGDFSPKNVLLHAERMVLLDHEVAHFGDPAFDIGFAMAHFLSKGHHVSTDFFEAARLFWRSYSSGWSPYRGFEQRCARHSIACTLARVCGRSPLEYLDAAERSRQREAAFAVLAAAPEGVLEMIEAFRKELACR